MARRAVVGKTSVDNIKEGVAEGANSLPSDEDRNIGLEDTGEVEHNFPEKYKEPLKGMLYLGALTSSFEYATHKFTLRTLTEGQLLKAAQLVSQFEETLGYDIAYHCAIVSQAVVDVDGEPLAASISMSVDLDKKRFAAVLDWYPVAVDHIYIKYLELDAVATAIGEELGKA